MSNFSNCGCGGCGCGVCSPSNVIYNAPCTDPGSATTGAHLEVLDSNFCRRRLVNAAGFVVINSTPSGYQVSATSEPQITFSNFSVASGSTIGTLLVQGSDGIIRALQLPATPNLYLSTNALGQLILGPLPNLPVPDPLAVTTANITTLTVANQTITAGLKFTGLSTGTVISTIGLDAGGNVIIGSASTTGIQAAMFFESPTSPAPSPTPNQNATAGTILVIGNELYDSGGGLFTVTNSQTLSVAVAGKYILFWEGQVAYTGGGTGTPAIQLLINGVVVNNGNGRPGISSTTDRTAFTSGVEARDLEAGWTVQLQLSSTAGTNTHVYEVRLAVQKFA